MIFKTPTGTSVGYDTDIQCDNASHANTTSTVLLVYDQ